MTYDGVVFLVHNTSILGLAKEVGSNICDVLSS